MKVYVDRNNMKLLGIEKERPFYTGDSFSSTLTVFFNTQLTQQTSVTLSFLLSNGRTPRKNLVADSSGSTTFDEAKFGYNTWYYFTWNISTKEGILTAPGTLEMTLALTTGQTVEQVKFTNNVVRTSRFGDNENIVIFSDDPEETILDFATNVSNINAKLDFLDEKILFIGDFTVQAEMYAVAFNSIYENERSIVAARLNGGLYLFLDSEDENKQYLFMIDCTAYTLYKLKNDGTKTNFSGGYSDEEIDTFLSLKEALENKTSIWHDQPNNRYYPTEKLVKDTIDNLKTASDNKYVRYDIDQALTLTEKQRVKDNLDIFSGRYDDLIGLPIIPTALSQLNNDTGFITQTVTNLINYYLKDETYTKQEVNQLLLGVARFKVVASLPISDIQYNIVYLVPKDPAQTNNLYDEYVYVEKTENNTISYSWEKIGDTEMDLSDYATLEDLARKNNVIQNGGDVYFAADNQLYLQTDYRLKINNAFQKPDVPTAKKRIAMIGTDLSEEFATLGDGLIEDSNSIKIDEDVVPTLNNTNIFRKDNYIVTLGNYKLYIKYSANSDAKQTVIDENGIKSTETGTANGAGNVYFDYEYSSKLEKNEASIYSKGYSAASNYYENNIRALNGNIILEENNYTDEEHENWYQTTKAEIYKTIRLYSKYAYRNTEKEFLLTPSWFKFSEASNGVYTYYYQCQFGSDITLYLDANLEDYVSLDSAKLDLNNKRIVNVSAPLDDNDAANKEYVDDSIANISVDLGDYTQDATHRLVTDDEKTTWNGKQNAINDLEAIRSGASAGATAVQDSNYVHTDNNYTTDEKNKLAGVEAGAQVNPTNVSSFNNDVGYLTQHQSLSGYATQTWVQQQGYLTSHQDIGQATLTSNLGLGTLKNNTGWGTTTSANGYTVRWGSDQPAGGGFVISEKSGQTHIQIDGEVWVEEGQKRLAHIDEIPTSLPANGGNADSIKNLGNQTAVGNGTRLPSGLQLYQVYNNGYPTSYGNVLNIGGDGDGQLLIGWSGTTGKNAPCFVRSRRDADTVWSSWQQLAMITDIPSTPHQYRHIFNFYDSDSDDEICIGVCFNSSRSTAYSWADLRSLIYNSNQFVLVGRYGSSSDELCYVYATSSGFVCKKYNGTTISSNLYFDETFEEA